MAVLYFLLIKLIPLYALIFLGYLAAKYLSVPKEPVAKLLVYIMNPAVILYATWHAELTASNLLLPLFFFIISCIAAFIFFKVGNIFWRNDSTKNLLSYTAGTANTGYFGLPVMLLVFGEKTFAVAALALFGFTLYENTVGYYVTARGNYTAKESLMKVIKLPAIYTFFIGIFLNHFCVNMPQSISDPLQYFKGTYSILGMMIIGLGMFKVRIKNVDWKFIGLSFIARFIFWPILMFSVIYFDKNSFHFFTNEAYNVMALYACVPLAASTVVFSTELNVQPEKAAIAVLFSTLFALVYIPLVMSMAGLI